MFLQIVHATGETRPIPGKSYSFETLKQVQALGDFEALKNKGRRVLRVMIKGDLNKGIEHLEREWKAAISE